MGNTQSVEPFQHPPAPGENNSKRPPHKLSKPRVGKHASPLTPTQTAGLLASHGRTASSSLTSSRRNSLAPPKHSREPSASSIQPTSSPSPVPNALPAMEPEPTPTPTPAPASASASASASDPAPAARDWKRRASLFRSKSSLESRRNDKKKDAMALSPEAGDRMSRANSMTWESQKAMDHARQLQVESWHIPGNRQSINYNLMSYESRRLLNLSEDVTASEDNSIMSESKFEVSRNTWKSSHPHQPTTAQITRTDSEVSLYAPVRRRSVVQRPGLATRTPMEYSASRRSSFRNSGPTTPAGCVSRMDSLESSISPIPPLTQFVDEPEYLPELSPEPVLEPIERALTPSDMEYRPLGAMKFGSLRITNGAASPLVSPDLEPPSKHQQRRGDEDLARDNEAVALEHRKMGVKFAASTVQQPSAAPTMPHPIKTSIPKMQLQRQRSKSPISPELQISSKHTAAEDELFEDDVEMEYSAEILTVRNDPNAKPSAERLRAERSLKNSLGVARADSGIVASPTTEHQPKPLSKADSGYSSNVSLRSSSHARRAVARKDRPHRTVSEESADDKTESSSSPVRDARNAGSGKTVELAPDSSGPAFSSHPSSPPKDDGGMASPSSTIKRTISSPNPFSRKHHSGGSASGAGSEKSSTTLSIGSALFRAGRLQRLLSGSGMRGPPVVHDPHPPDDSVPPVPRDVQAKLNEHSGLFRMSPRRLTVRAQASKDTLKTIFSVGSLDAGHAGNQRDGSPVAGRKLAVRKPVAKAVEPSEENPNISRSRSFQSMSASTTAHATASVTSQHSIRRKPVPSAEAQKDQPIEEERSDETRTGHGSNVAAFSRFGKSVGQGASDQAYAAIAYQEGAHELGRRRTFTMTAQMERNMAKRLHPGGLMPPSSGNSNFSDSPLPSPYGTRTDAALAKRKTSPPISLHTRSSKNPWNQAPSRPHTAHSGEADHARRQTLSRQNSRETIHSYPSTSPATHGNNPVSSIFQTSPQRSTVLEQQQYAMSRQAAEASWRSFEHRNADSRPNANLHMRGGVSSVSLGPHHHQQLRHRASYDNSDQQQYHGPVARGYPPRGLDPGQNGGYHQHQSREIQQHQLEQQDNYYPDVAQPGLSRSRSRSRSMHAHDNPPYRILHSYNSPAYRNAPIWG